MKKKKNLKSLFLNRYSNVITENSTIKIAILVLGAIVLTQQHTINKAKNEEFVVIVPPGFKGEMQVSRNMADAEYLKSMVRYTTMLHGQVSAGNVDRRFSELMTLVHPSVYPTFKEKMKTRADLIKRFSSISYIVDINDSKALDVEGDTIKVSASRRKVVGRDISIPEPFVYELKYKIENGTFSLLDIKELKQ